MVNLYGLETEDFGRLAVFVMPCNLGMENDTVVPVDNPNCELDQEE